jgi:hypothetical protein
MAAFNIKIAGFTASVTSLFDSTKDYCRSYLSDDAPDFSIRVKPEDLVYEQDFLDAEAEEEGLRRRKFTDPFLERAAIQRMVAENLISRDVLLLHGSTVAVDGQSFLFTARCGTGKSTHTRFYREVFGDRAVMVNDDKPFLRITDAGIFASGSPWSGKHGLDTNITVPLKGICILERGETDRIQPLDPDAATTFLLWQSYCPIDPEKAGIRQELVNKLAYSVPLWRMDCTKDIHAAEVAFDAMSQ